MEVLDIRFEEGAGGDAECLVLDALKFLYVGSAGGREPYRCGVGEDGLDDGVVG